MVFSTTKSPSFNFCAGVYIFGSVVLTLHFTLTSVRQGTFD